MIKTKFSHKVIAIFLTLNFLIGITPFNLLHANNNGPTAPEAVGFEPVDATDMVNLTNGNLSYVLPLLNMDGFPVNLSYHAGISPNLEASWVGLGWYLNPGAINRGVNSTPDDWKSGVGIQFTSFSETTDYYSITASIGVTGVPVSTSIGANWGGGQGLSGSVNARMGLVSYYADTRGNLGVSIGLGIGPNVSFSNNSKPSYSVGIGGGADIGDKSFGNGSGKASVGMSFSGGGSFSVGASVNGIGASFSQSSSSDTNGDASIDTKSMGLSITVPIGPLSVGLGFRKTRVKVSILKGYENREWGVLYASDYTSFTDNKIDNSRMPLIERGSFTTDGFLDYMYRGNQLDTYSTRLPQSEEEFIGDYSKEIENINFTYVAYDKYDVAAQGMMGSLTPYVFQNANIVGKGGRATSGDDKLHVFWHHGESAYNTQRSLTNSNKPFEFYFNGQFTSNETNSGDILSTINMSNVNYMNDFLSIGSHNGEAINSNRAHQGNFVEVFTNQEIKDNEAYGLITPKDVPNSLRGNQALFDPTGIGGYKITATDGKTYHFALPVYHYEKVERKQIEGQEHRNDIPHPIDPNTLLYSQYDCDNVSEKRQFTRFATHWLLTAITGSDYVDTNNNGQFDESDYGYWVELEYGKWSDGYVWRSPYQDFVYDYSTNIAGEIESKDKGHYSFGRKQIYYLDRINTRHKSALFVKDIRYDGFGKDLTFKFLNKNRNENEYVGGSGSGGTDSNSLNYTNPDVHVKEDFVHYSREYSLLLDKIILVDAEDADLVDETGNSNLGSAIFPNYVPNDNLNYPNWSSPYFEEHYGQNYSYGIHQEGNVLDVGDLPSTFIQDHAIKVVDLNYDYQLVGDTPSSKINDVSYGTNTNAGRLTLKYVKTHGRGNYDFMPPTTFEYYDDPNIENPNFQPVDNNDIQQEVEDRRNFVDAWGYMENDYQYNGETRSRVDLWSLRKINTPTGASIEIDYEEDDYWTEAFARRYWQDNLIFDVEKNDPTNSTDIHVKKDPQYAYDIDFSKYFYLGEKVYIDLWICRKQSEYEGFPIGGYHTRTGEIDLQGGERECYVTSVSNQEIVIHFEDNSGLYNGSRQNQYLGVNSNYWYGTRDGLGSPNYEPESRGQCPPTDLGGNNHSISYKLLANKVPEDQTGGGVRVKEIVTKDNNNESYKVQYDYTHPTKNKNDGTPRSSGITSYAPVDGVKYVPYQSEVPAPGVMYEYVTMKETDESGNYNTETRYRHHVLKPVFNIFNPNIEIEASDSDAPGEDQLFWANVTENAGGLDGSNAKKVEAKKIDININTALFGQVKSIEILNKYGHVVNKTENQYVNGRILTGEILANDNSYGYDEPNKGYTKETFNSLKSVFVANNSNATSIDNSKTKRLLSISSKTDYNNALKKVITSSGGHSSYVEFSDVDPWLGSFTQKKIELADGTTTYSKTIPAYTKYQDMGSKVLDTENKNMLTQKAMSITKLGSSSSSQILNASINTWRDTWTYRDNYGINNTQGGIWRKHKSFVWKDDVNSTTGAYATTVNESNNYFNWGTGTPTSNKWQEVSETTRYTHWSVPLETKDINTNFASSKMADNFSKVIASGNARYTEMYYSGAEYVASGNTFEGEVKGANFRTNEVSHTGEYSVKNTNANDKVFLVTGDVSSGHNDYSNKDFRPGKYKVSFWSQNQYNVNAATVKLNNISIPVSETVEAGCWKQFNYYVDLDSNTSFELYVTNTSGGGFYFDDFRMHPAYASMNSFVYDLETDELLYILDANNLGSAYRYDKAGRLKATYQEVVDTDLFDGGFKILQQYKQQYQNLSNYNTTYNEDINNCLLENYNPLELKKFGKECVPQFNPYDILYGIDVYGGSGNYKYEWQYMIDFANGTFSNWYEGGNKEFIPYSNKYCNTNTFDKYWIVNAKVTDLITGEVVSTDDEFFIDNCIGFISNPDVLLGVEASYCHDKCRDSQYMFHLYPLDSNLPLPTNTGYVDNNTGTSYAVDLEKGEGLFCPEIRYVPSVGCESEYIEYVSITPLHNNSTNYSYDFYLDCVSKEDLENYPERILGSAPNPEFTKPGFLVLKISEEIVQVIDTNNQ